MSGQQHAPAALYLRERPGTHFTGGWVGPRAGLDGRKISSPPGFDPGPSSPQSVAIPTELSGPHIIQQCFIYIYIYIRSIRACACSPHHIRLKYNPYTTGELYSVKHHECSSLGHNLSIKASIVSLSIILSYAHASARKCRVSLCTQNINVNTANIKQS